MPAPLTEFAAAKINLSLHVLARRADGYHELDSIVAFADVGDELTFSPAEEFSLTASGPFAHLLPAPEQNIITKGWAALRGPPVVVHLTKNLPVAAGIGGGSANAAAAIRAHRRLTGKSADVALSLGADVPVCLLSRATRMQGIGERVKPLKNFTPLHAVLVNPGVAVSTAAAFARLRPAADTSPWRNDLLMPAKELAPEIATVIAALKDQPGLARASLSGSGATCFGIFDDAPAARAAAHSISATYPAWWVRQTILR